MVFSDGIPNSNCPMTTTTPCDEKKVMWKNQDKWNMSL